MCVRCHVNIPDKALFCPWCGKQQDAMSAPVHRKKRRRPKGSGTVYLLGGENNEKKNKHSILG